MAPHSLSMISIGGRGAAFNIPVASPGRARIVASLPGDDRPHLLPEGQAQPRIEAVSMSVPAGRSSGSSALDRDMPLGYEAAQEWQLGQGAEYFCSAVHEWLNYRKATTANGNRKHNLIGNAGGRHHFRDALTHGQAALLIKAGDRHAEQAVRNVPTFLQS